MVPAPRPRSLAPALWRRLGSLGVATSLLAEPALAATAPPTHTARTTRCAPGKPSPDPGAKPTAVAPDPAASKSGADLKPGKPAPKDSKPGASKPDPKTSKPVPKDSASKPAPKDSKSAARAGATKPAPKDSKPVPKDSTSDSKPVPKDSPPAAPAPAAGGYWLGARLLGAGAAAALSDMSHGTAPDPTAPDAGVVGQVQSMPEAMAWVARWAFGDVVLAPPAREPIDSPLALGPAPIPGGALYSLRGAALHALIVRGRNLDGSARAIRWPSSAAELTPPDHPWLSAVLLAERAPLFAAPAARVPPASERFAFARRGGSLWLLGHVDRCSLTTGERVCLRWAQVISRHGDEFHAGYLPASQVALVDGWQRGAGAAPRAQLLVSGSVGARAQLLLVARTRDGGLHRRTVQAPMQGDSYPAARLRVEGEWAIVECTGAPAQRIALDASLDARTR
jgi:hypothetical protein